ncbi:hypothetical protein [Streptomyces sp. NPDC001270]|uniref:hypothetical protein n=1 Tax=Streptomyces sp. NPDC001270 TaxID=3364554 RepID=UPI00369B3874
MIRPQVTADGRAVRIPLADRIAPVLDELAIAYANQPDVIGALLDRHAATVLALDHAVCSEDSTDYGRAMAAAEADGTREALLDECPAAAHPDDLLSPDEAVTLATRLTKRAAHIRNTQNRSTRQ